uniref:NRPS n=1 Tax=Preussia typharum TaxID=718249 RepID=A0A8A0Y2B5_9PLEO|nr:NRPS [Preussia typharum]
MDTLQTNLCELFAQSVARCPDNLAVDHEQGCLTYRGLDISSTVLSRTLVDLGVSKASPVVLVTAHGSFNIIAILAILKAGSSFVPIDRTSWSPEKIRQVFDTVQSSLVINTTPEQFTPPTESCRVLNISSIPYASPLDRDVDAPFPTIDPDDTACVMFTSGSTGRPKGVMISHKSLCLYSKTSPVNMDVGPGDRLLHILSVAFDVVPAEPADLYQKAMSCTVMAATPSLLNNLPTPTSDETMFSRMHTVLLGGETASPDLLGSWVDAGVRVFVAYGLSETTSLGAIHQVERDPDTGIINPFIIGPYMEESPVYLLDQDSTQIVEEGVDGEIVIGGAGVAKGYFNDDEKTRKSFTDWKGLRIYRTGDYARWIRGPSGNRLLEFVGRRDRFTKNSGFTVNLDRDVEEKLYQAGKSLGVKSVHAVGTETGIVAVVTPSCIDTAVLLENAHEIMCTYCVPNRIEAIEEFPLSSSGKAQSQTILDILSSIDNEKDVPTTSCPPVSKTLEISTNGVTAEESKRAKVLNAAGEVLGCSKGMRREIKPDDSFIGMGGSSLLAIKLVSVLRRLKLHLSVRDLFSCRTFSEMAKRASTTAPPDPTARWIAEDPLTARSLADLRAKACTTLGYANAKFDIGPLTSLQLELAMPTLANDAMNVNQVKMTYSKEYIRMAEKAWSAVWRAEPVFRTEITLMIGSGAQIVHREAIRKPTITNFVDRAKYEAAVKQINMSVGLGCRLDFMYLRETTISNGNGPGTRSETERTELTVVLTIHHSLMDGSSLEFLLDNVERASKGKPLEFSPSSVDANLGLIATQRMHDREARSFFGNYLKDVPMENKASLKHRNAMQQKYSGLPNRTTVAQWFAPSVSIEDVTLFARKHDVSAACVYYCAWAMAISAYEGSDNVVVGAVFSNRTAQPGHEKTIGPYMATLPLVFNLEANESVVGRLQKTMDDLMRLREFAWTRSDQVGIGHRLGNILALQLPLPDETSSPPPLRVETLENSDFPLSMLVETTGQLRMLYNDRQFDSATVQRIGEHFKYALYSVTTEKRVGDCMKINHLHETLLAQADFANNEKREETVKTALERAADRFKGHAALEDCYGTTVTYEELDQKSNAIARNLNENLPDFSAVAVFGDGTINWVLSIVAILKTGRIYVPLDPKWSIDRRARVCDESGATALLLPRREQEFEAPPELGLKVFFTDQILEGGQGKMNFARLPTSTCPDDDLVAVYTSGSTGVPKGIPLTNRGILALLRGCPEATMFAAPGTRIAQFMSPAFDYCNIELFCTLLHGATLVLRDPRDPYAHLRKVDFATITPSVLTALNPDDYPNLKMVKFRTNAFAEHHADVFSRYIQRVSPSRTHFVVTSYTRVIPGDPITVGVAVPTVRMYILDESQEHVPEGTKGEIYIAGIQVMRGYLQASKLSAQRVLTDPWHNGQRMYRTGDFGSRGQDGRVTYLGRIDRQVKLRGFRVELAEVESAVMAGPKDEGITRCTAVAINGTLVAFISCNPVRTQLELEDLITRMRERLDKRLFSSAMPQFFIQLEDFPMNLNGKVDVKALEQVYAKRMSARSGETALEATSNEVEAKVADEWRQILQLGPDAHIQPTDNFFGLGGHSVLVLLLANRLATAFQVEITLRELLPVPTFHGQVELVKNLVHVQPTNGLSNGVSNDTESQDVGTLRAEELTELERKVWLQCKVATTPTAFNIVKVLDINGFVDVERLVDSFNRALASDPVLRTNIVDGPQGPVRVLSKCSPVVHRVSEIDIEAELNMPFDLERDQLMRIFLAPDHRQAHTEKRSAMRIVIVSSHVIVDLGSLQNLLQLTSEAYSGTLIPSYPIPRHLESSRWKTPPSPREREWWKNYMKGRGYHDHKLPFLHRPLQPTSSGYFNGLSRTRQYSGKLVADLNARSRETGTTQHHLALATAALLLQWFSGENDLVLGAPDSGRRSIVERESLGQFLDALPIRVQLPQDSSKDDWGTNTLLTEVRDTAHMALANAIPFSRIMETLDFPDGAIDYPIFECMVTFHTRGAGLNNWLQLPDCNVSESTMFAPGSKFPLLMEWSETGVDEWMVHIEYDTDRLSSATMDTVEGALDVILEAVAKDSPLHTLQDQLRGPTVIHSNQIQTKGIVHSLFKPNTTPNNRDLHRPSKMRQSILLTTLTTITGTLAATTPSQTFEFFFPSGVEGVAPVAEIVSVNPSTTVANIHCPTGADSTECGWGPGLHYSILTGTRYKATMVDAQSATMTMNCDHDKQNSAIYCDYSVGGAGAENPISTTLNFSGTEIQSVTATVTKGAELLTKEASATEGLTVIEGSKTPTASMPTVTGSGITGVATPIVTQSGVAPSQSTGAAYRFGVEGSAVLALVGAAALNAW